VKCVAPAAGSLTPAEISNLRMVESKSARTFNEINAHSEKSAEFSPKGINRLAADSE
jgi:hypothetical protein